MRVTFASVHRFPRLLIISGRRYFLPHVQRERCRIIFVRSLLATCQSKRKFCGLRRSICFQCLFYGVCRRSSINGWDRVLVEVVVLLLSQRLCSMFFFSCNGSSGNHGAGQNVTWTGVLNVRRKIAGVQLNWFTLVLLICVRIFLVVSGLTPQDNTKCS